MPKQGVIVLLLCFLLPKITFSQAITEQEAVSLAVKNHPLIQKNQTQIAHAKQLVPTAKTLPATDFYAETPQFLMGPDNVPIWTVLGAQQSFLSPKVYKQQEKTLQQQVKLSESELAISAHDIEHQARVLYQNCLFLGEKIRYEREQDSIFKEFNRVAEVEFRVGKITPLDKTTAESFYKNIQQLLRGSEIEYENALSELRQYLKMPQVTVNQFFVKLSNDKIEKTELPIQLFYTENERLQMEKAAQQKLATTPIYTVGISQYVFNRYVPPVVRVGITVPLWTKGWKAAEQAAEIEIQVAQKEREVIDFQLNTAFKKAENEVQLAAQNVDYFEKIGLSQAFDILKTADKMKQLGSVTTFEYLQSIRQAFDLKMAYLTALRMYNEAVLRLTYFK